MAGESSGPNLIQPIMKGQLHRLFGLLLTGLFLLSSFAAVAQTHQVKGTVVDAAGNAKIGRASCRERV